MFREQNEVGFAAAIMINSLRLEPAARACDEEEENDDFRSSSRINSWSVFVQRVSFPLVVIFLAAIFSGLLEKVSFLNNTHILTIIGAIALIAVGLSGRLSVVLSHPIARWLLFFTVWFIPCALFGFWPGGSIFLLRDAWSRSVLLSILLAGCVVTVKQCKTIYKTLGYSVGFLAIMALVLRGVDKNGRLGLLGTRYENSNDFAWTLVLGLSFFLFLIFRGERDQRTKIIAVMCSVAILLALVKTGSRGGMIAFLMMAAYGYYQSSRRMKIRLGLLIPLLLLALYFIAPSDIRVRYTTFFGSGKNYTGIDPNQLSPEERLEANAAASAEARKAVLKDSLYLTMVHPLLGVGPGNFQVAQNALALARGDLKGMWAVSHNTYTQISSEMGIIGLAIYVMFLYQCFKPLNSITSSKYPGKDWDDLRGMAKSMRTSFVVLLTMALFDSYGYDTNIPILAGLTCALSFIAARKRALMKLPSQDAAPLSESSPEPALEPAWTGVR
jgi:O-antigen ligase